MNIVVLIPIHNGVDSTISGLDSLYKSIAYSRSNIKIRVLIIDDGSTDESCKMIKKYFQDVEIIQGDGTLWWTGAIEEGSRYAFYRMKASHILLWNNDIQPHQLYMQNLIKIIHSLSDQYRIICSTIMYKENPQVVYSMGGRIDKKTGAFSILNKNMSIDSVDESIYNVDYFGGMGTCISKEIYETVGQFDRINFPHYKGDYDYAMRAGKLGIKMNAHRILQIWNDKKSSGITPSTLIGMLKMYFNEKSPFYIKRNLLFYKKHEFPPSAYINLIIRFMNNIIGHSIRILLGPTIYKYNQKYKLKQIVEP
jgi:GT2 family glycosyltransferase